MANATKQLPTSSWDWLYQHALRETDRGRLLPAIDDAIKLMVQRLHELGPESPVERRRLLTCIEDLRVLQISASSSLAYVIAER